LGKIAKKKMGFRAGKGIFPPPPPITKIFRKFRSGENIHFPFIPEFTIGSRDRLYSEAAKFTAQETKLKK